MHHYRQICMATIIIILLLLKLSLLFPNVYMKPSSQEQNFRYYYDPINPYIIYDINDHHHFGIYNRYIPYDYDLPEYIG